MKSKRGNGLHSAVQATASNVYTPAALIHQTSKDHIYTII